jgi:flagellar motor switch protein FliM
VEDTVSRALAETPAAVTRVDFRRPSRINRDAVVALESAHENFVRRLVTAWGTSTHAVLEIEHLATEQLSVDDYVRTLPNPTVIATLRVGPLGANALVDMDLPLALLLVERLLGGAGNPAETAVPRRPTDLETSLIAHDLLIPAVGAVDEAFRDLEGEPSELLGVESTPQPMQLSAPGELLLLLTYRVEVRGEQPGHGLLSLGYPVAPLLAQLDRLVIGANGDGADGAPAAREAVAGALLRAPLDLHVRLGGTPLPASVLAGLQPGDVLRLDHPVAQPAELVCDGQEVGLAHLGRRGRRLAVQIVVPPASSSPPAPAPAATSPATPAATPAAPSLP